MSTLLVSGFIAFAASLLLSAVVLRYVRARGVLDVPGERSSHAVPTPRGGGLAIVAVVLGGVAVLFATGRLSLPLGMALLVGGALVASIGWIDDLRGVSARLRLAVHTLAAIWAVAWLGGLPSLVVGSDAVRLGAAGVVLAGLAIVWAINLYNFMDGIDGLAAAEAAVVALAAAAFLARRDASLAAVAAIVAGAAIGFLPWNWQRARIFMGDVGSGFLGFVLATLALASENGGAMPALAWLLLLGVFFTDATVTLVRRALRRERWYAAHREHAYQRATRAGWSHGQVTSAVVLLDLGLAIPTWLSIRRPELLLPMLLLATLALVGVYFLVERRRPMLPQSPGGEMEKPAL
jgi:Fuc2NAc and GlcNAc transferase